MGIAGTWWFSKESNIDITRQKLPQHRIIKNQEEIKLNEDSDINHKSFYNIIEQFKDEETTIDEKMIVNIFIFILFKLIAIYNFCTFRW